MEISKVHSDLVDDDNRREASKQRALIRFNGLVSD